jgi:hypothetical protein
VVSTQSTTRYRSEVFFFFFFFLEQDKNQPTRCPKQLYTAVVKEKRRQREREVINIILNKFGSPRGQCVLDRNRTQAHTRKSTDGAGGERRGAKNVLL